jgi:hypothetical protein
VAVAAVWLSLCAPMTGPWQCSDASA